MLGVVDLRRLTATGRVDHQTIAQAVATALPPLRIGRIGPARVGLVADRAAVVAAVSALSPSGGVVSVSEQPAWSVIPAPVIAQRLHNDCEAAALQVLLATRGVRVDQLDLQRAFPRSGPLDPTGNGPTRTWGDPDQGFVGRPDGGGVAGGFGVYPGPLSRTAARYGVILDDVSASSVEVIRGRLLAGQAVMAWVGLSTGPDASWQSPAGRPITVNFGEHTVVLAGVLPDGRFIVINPLDGTRELWTEARFQTQWKLLGRRALAA